MDDVDQVVTRGEALRGGLSDHQLRALVTAGSYRRIAAGSYLASGGRPPLRSRGPAAVRPRAEAVAAALRGKRVLVVSHGDAASAWGLPTPIGGLGPVRLSTRTGSRESSRVVRVVVAPLAPADVVVAPGGVLVTGLARTVADCARTLPGRDALAIADAALRTGRIVVDDVLAHLAARPRAPGSARARLVLDLADARRESPFESWSAWGFEDVGLPRPTWQAEIRDERGRVVARADCRWGRVLGEADGRSKALLRAEERGGADAERLAWVLHAEREREVRVRRLGFEMVRWTPADLFDPRRLHGLAAHVLRLLGPVGPLGR